MKGAALLFAAVLLGSAAAANATTWLHELDRALAAQSPGGFARAELSGLFDLEGFLVDEQPPGLLFGGDGAFVNPRLRLFLDGRLGERTYLFVQARIDRGFDPRSRSSGTARLDEYLLRYTLLDDPALNVQIGKFATVVGNWVARHDSWRNPFVNAPLPYENVTTASDRKIVPGPGPFLARRTTPDRKRIWVPIVWGPGYASGASLFGHFERIDWAVEVKNASVSSRPVLWDVESRDFDHPTASARVGWRPGAAWNVGASFSDGPWLDEGTERALPPGRDLGDFRQTLAAADLAWAWRHVELWSELFLTRFEIPNVGDADSVAYYLEGRYRVSPRLFAALRWNRQLFGTIEDDAGSDRRWDRDTWRVDAALTARYDRHLQVKLQYAFTRQSGGRQQGPQLLAAQLTLSF